MKETSIVQDIMVAQLESQLRIYQVECDEIGQWIQNNESVGSVKLMYNVRAVKIQEIERQLKELKGE